MTPTGKSIFPVTPDAIIPLTAMKQTLLSPFALMKKTTMVTAKRISPTIEAAKAQTIMMRPTPPIERAVTPSLSFGAITFPPFQEFPIFIESATIPFDENGASTEITFAFEPPPVRAPLCADELDNDLDGLIDYPSDPGCENPLDNDETDLEEKAVPIRLDIPGEYIKVIQKADLEVEYLAILPNAQEGRLYEFTFEGRGGLEPDEYLYGVRGRTPNVNNEYPLTNSGLVLNANGELTGQPGALSAGHYRYQFTITDGDQLLNFGVQIAVYDALGNPTGLIMESSLAGSEHKCLVDEECEAFFRATKGIAPYNYSFSGESPIGPSILQVNVGEAFYRFTPTLAHVGTYNMSITVSDSSEKRETEKGELEGEIASFDFTLIIEEPPPPPPEEVEIEFKFAPERQCEFLDLSNIDEAFPFFQFTCRNGIMEGFQGNIRAFDPINRAEAAKITTIIVSQPDEVEGTFRPFANLPPLTIVNYNDVTVGDWFAKPVYYLFRQGIIIDNVVYRPADFLTVAEAMKLIIEAYAALSIELLDDLEDITDYEAWFEPYQIISQYVDATISRVDPASQAERVLIAELLYKLNEAYPTDKFK